MVNSGFGVNPQLPTRRDDAVPRTPSALMRRNAFARRHPEIPITTRRQDGRLIFEVFVPGSAVATYDDANAMMNDLEVKYH